MNTSGSSAPFKTNFYYGWVIVFIAGLGVFFSGPGQTYSVSVTAIAIGFGVLWGISGGFERIALNYVWPSFFGRKSLGSIKGAAMTVTVLGSALGPLPFGLAYDLFGGYEEILLMTIILPILGITESLLAKKPVKEF